MEVSILTPDKKLFEGTADRVGAPGTDGEFEVLADHAPLVAALAPGIVLVTAGRDVTSIDISGGFIEVIDNRISLIVQQGTTPIALDGSDSDDESSDDSE